MAINTYNITDIWKEVSNIGYTRHINVVDGTERIVPWGQLQWLGFAWSALTFTAITVGAGAYIYYVAHKFI